MISSSLLLSVILVRSLLTIMFSWVHFVLVHKKKNSTDAIKGEDEKHNSTWNHMPLFFFLSSNSPYNL